MNIRHILLWSLAALSASGIVRAQDCELDICVVAPDAAKSGISEGTAETVAKRLARALTASGTAADENYGQLYLSASFSHLYTETLPGPPMQDIVRTQMTVFVADIFGHKVFDSETFELRGVGSGEQRAFINALSPLNGRNRQLEAFVARAKAKTVDYFDRNYRSLLEKARSAASMRDYEQALYFTTLIPTCSKGYAEASKATQTYYKAYIDYIGTQLLTKAKAEFAASPNSEGAYRAYALLGQIDPESSAYKAAMKFAEEVKARSMAEYDFEFHRPYEDAIALERARIDAAKAIGVAYGRGQKNQTTNILWK